MIVPKLSVEQTDAPITMDQITLVRQKLANRVEEEKLAISIRDFYAKDSVEWARANVEVKFIHDKIMELSFQLKGLTSLS